jgi:hypothetical protein
MGDTPYIPPENKKLKVPKVRVFLQQAILFNFFDRYKSLTRWDFSGGFVAFTQTIPSKMVKQNKKTLLL